jgi:hypothetical protein
MRRALSTLLAAFLACAPASATWSILIVNRATGEVAIFQATCVPGADLLNGLACVRPGLGVGAVQGGFDGNGLRRVRIWNNLPTQTPQWILDERLLPLGATHGYQYGIVSAILGDPVSYTGFALNDACGEAGTFGDYAYAVQGNAMAGDAVCGSAIAALMSTEGDLITKLMAAAEVSRNMGGDGRCSCNVGGPGTCGTPPPAFDKAAHTGYAVVARVGNAEGVCNVSAGCANGDYHYVFNFVGGTTSPDPVLELLADYQLWRQAMVGVPDQFLSQVERSADELVADGISSCTITVRLVDRDGRPLTVGGQTLTVVPRHAGPEPATVGPLSDHGDGTHSFALTATTDAGRGSWEIWVNDGQRDVLLLPHVGVESVPLVDLHASRWELSAGAGGDVLLTLNRGAQDAGRPYRVLGSLAGTTPGTTLGGVTVPLNADRLFAITLGATDLRVFDGFVGALDAGGHAAARLHLEPGHVASLVGATFHFAALFDDVGQGFDVSAPDGFLLLP